MSHLVAELCGEPWTKHTHTARAAAAAAAAGCCQRLVRSPPKSQRRERESSSKSVSPSPPSQSRLECVLATKHPPVCDFKLPTMTVLSQPLQQLTDITKQLSNWQQKRASMQRNRPSFPGAAEKPSIWHRGRARRWSCSFYGESPSPLRRESFLKAVAGPLVNPMTIICQANEAITIHQSLRSVAFEINTIVASSHMRRVWISRHRIGKGEGERRRNLLI